MIKINQFITQDGNCIKKFVDLNNMWKQVVEEHIASNTIVTKITRNTLNVIVKDNILHTELSYMNDDIVSKLEKFGLNINKIKYIYSPYTSTDKKKELIKNQIGDRELFYIEKCSKVIDNEELRKSFKNAMRAYFERYTFDEFINGINI